MASITDVMANIMEKHERQQRGDNTMKRLFCVKNGRGNIIDNPKGGQYFDDKMEAKAFRNSLVEYPPYTVSRGPDHIGPRGHTVKRMRLQPKHVASYTGL